MEYTHLGRTGLMVSRFVLALDEALRTADLVLPPDLMVALDSIFPGPGGIAPEAYCGF